MDIGSVLVALALAILAGAFIARPLFQPESGRGTDGVDERQLALVAEKNRILATLQELEEDHAMGKILAEDYQAQRASLLTKGAAVLRSIDQLHGDLVAQAAISGSPLPTKAEEALEAAVASRRKRTSDEGGGSCSQCGSPVKAGDRYCSRCGASLGAEARKA